MGLNELLGQPALCGFCLGMLVMLTFLWTVGKL